MVEVEVGTLIGRALDYVIATIEELPIQHDPMGFCDTANGGYWVWDKRPGGKMLQIGPKPAGHNGGYYSPSTRWDQLGPLVMKYPIVMGNHESGKDDGKFWGSAHCFHGGTEFDTYDGVMVAACRAIVAYTHGPTVKIPRSLLH
ncbi:DUF2591 family protein [Ectopseudomonas hydrolytica]|uniref:DUF2591 family protein n=1 Tax=Ectopseudomonas hydrolytica TaxID=2493633 RepID=UPI00107EFE13